MARVRPGINIRIDRNAYAKMQMLSRMERQTINVIVDRAMDALIAQQSGRRRANAPAQEGHLTNDPHGNPTTGGN